MKQLFAFDFDGTLTTRDTLIAFIRYACGTPRFLLGFLLHAPSSSASCFTPHSWC